MKIVELKIDDSLIAGIDAVALVESPAIEQDFIAFNKQYFESYDDYPQAAVDAAKQGIKRNKEIDNECATQVGKVRAQQLANREPLTIDTIKRMRSFLIRQKDNYELAQKRKDYYACGYISYLLWGGPAALPWAEKKLRQAGIEFKDEVMQFAAEGRDVYLISCSAEKKDYKCAASELYDSALFKKSLDYTRKQTEDKFIKIISAQYGLVDLDQLIEPYDKTLKDMSADQRKEWAELVYDAILENFNVDKDRFIFLAGNAYTEYLLPKFKYNKDLLEGKRIGERMEYLDKFYSVTNNAFYAVEHKFNGVEKAIINEIIRQEMAEIGPRGGVKASPKAPKSKTKNPDPKGQGTAKGDASTTRGAEVDKQTEETLKKKSDDFNEKYKDKLGYGVNVGMLKSVYQRGLGAYNTSRSPAVAKAGGAKQWALARVNAFLYLVKEGRPQNKKYTTDYDLLPAKHPKKEEMSLIMDGLGIDVSGLPDYVGTGSMAKVGTPGPNFYDDKFSKQLVDKQMLVGPLMTPNKLIARVNEDGEEYYVYFTEDTVEKLAYKMMESKLTDSVNIEHDGDQKVDDIYLVETWLVKDPEKDKANLYGYQPVKGEWFGIYKVKNDKIWDEYVKTGKVKGFSVEGMFTQRVLMNKL